VPKRLQELGYEFKFPNLEDAFRHILKSWELRVVAGSYR
jgi:NAD dependent epimerase/dehydratase family enzyme